MHGAQRARTGNILLNCLSEEDFAFLEQHLHRVPLQEDYAVQQAGEPIREVCFPEAGVVSFHDVLSDGSRIGIGIIGREGFTGWSTLLGSETSPHEATVAIANGTALRLCAYELAEACRARSAIRELLMCYVHAFLCQMGRTIVSNLIDPVDRRLCRWLLMNQDRLEDPDIAITHKQISVMLGVRRASVTDALHILEGEHLIYSRRGHVTVRDTEGLRRVAGESYGVAEEEYRRLIAPFGMNSRSG